MTCIFNLWLLVWAKLNKDRINTIQGNIWRGITQAVISYFYLRSTDQPVIVNDDKTFSIVMWRNGLCILYNLTMYYMLYKIPISIISAI